MTFFGKDEGDIGDERLNHYFHMDDASERAVVALLLDLGARVTAECADKLQRPARNPKRVHSIPTSQAEQDFLLQYFSSFVIEQTTASSMTSLNKNRTNIMLNFYLSKKNALLRWFSLGPFRQILVIATLAVSCVSANANTRSSEGRRVCPPGTYDYGDGMVASVLPEIATHALEETHLRAQREAGQDLSDFLSEQPWRPHVSIIYGVTSHNATPAAQALKAFTKSHSSATACFGGLVYFDDPRGHKTALVVDVREPAHLFATLHDTLAKAANIGSRFNYHPHVTLAYLHEGMRFDKAQEAAIQAPLQNVCWRSSLFYLTDPCGQELYRFGSLDEALRPD